MVSHPVRSVRSATGMTLAELMIVVAIIAIAAGAAIPTFNQSIKILKLGSGMRQMESELQTARLRSVATSQPLQVRFNCPASGQYRIVQVTGNAAIDNDTSRCSTAKYPYPPTLNLQAGPNLDGPIRYMPSDVTLNGATDKSNFPVSWVQFNANGTMTPPTGTAAPINITMQVLLKSGTGGTQMKTVVVTQLGRVYAQ